MQNTARASAGDRCLFVISRFHPEAGGAETQARILAQSCARLGMPVEVLTAALPGVTRRETLGGVLVHRAIRLIRLPGLWGLSHFLGTLLFLLRHGQRYRSVLCFQLQAFHNPAALLWGALARRPVVLRGSCSGGFGDLATLRSMRSGPPLLLLRHAAAFVAVTEEMRAELVAAGIDPGRVAVIPNGVVIPPAREPGRDGSGAREILFAGRLHVQKGVASLLEAYAALEPGRRGLTLRIFGSGPEEPALRRLAGDLGLAGCVVFEGWSDRLGEELARGRMFVLPTLGEGMPNVLLEAMAAANPVIATDIPVIREVVTHGETGLLVPPRDAAALAAAMRRLLDEPGLASRLAAAARSRVAERFPSELAASRYLALFERLRAGGRR